MTTKMKRSLRHFAAAAVTVILGTGALTASANAGDWTPGYGSKGHVSEYAEDRRAERLMRQIVRSIFAATERRDRHEHRRAKLHRIKMHKRHHRHHRHHREICRTTTKIVFNKYGERRKITREVCRETPRRHRHWTR